MIKTKSRTVLLYKGLILTFQPATVFSGQAGGQHSCWLPTQPPASWQWEFCVSSAVCVDAVGLSGHMVMPFLNPVLSPFFHPWPCRTLGSEGHMHRVPPFAFPGRVFLYPRRQCPGASHLLPLTVSFLLILGSSEH